MYNEMYSFIAAMGKHLSDLQRQIKQFHNINLQFHHISSYKTLSTIVDIEKRILK